MLAGNRVSSCQSRRCHGLVDVVIPLVVRKTKEKITEQKKKAELHRKLVQDESRAIGKSSDSADAARNLLASTAPSSADNAQRSRIAYSWSRREKQAAFHCKHVVADGGVVIVCLRLGCLSSRFLRRSGHSEDEVHGHGQELLYREQREYRQGMFDSISRMHMTIRLPFR